MSSATRAPELPSALGVLRFVNGAKVLGSSWARPSRLAGMGQGRASSGERSLQWQLEIGDRKLYLTCKGTGTPTVILVSGYRNNAEIWTTPPTSGVTAVFEAVAKFTRVCAYDRPGHPSQPQRYRSDAALR